MGGCMTVDEIQFLRTGVETGEDFKQISDSLFGIKDIRQKTDLSKKEILGVIYLELLNEQFKKEQYMEAKITIIESFINLYTEYKVSEKRKGRSELVNSFIAKIERNREEEEHKELI